MSEQNHINELDEGNYVHEEAAAEMPTAPKLKEYRAEYLGVRTDREWPRFAWSIVINGERFEYNTGMEHCTLAENPQPASGRAAWKHKKKPEGSILARIKNDKRRLTGDPETVQVWVHVPTAGLVIGCLLLESHACDEGFGDWCDSLGYSEDSRKALEIYLACQENAKKLRKAIGADMQAWRAYCEQEGF